MVSKPSGLNKSSAARLLPFAEILDGLEDRQIGFHSLARDLLVDLLVEAVAQATG